MITGPRNTLKLARKLRSEMSLPEAILWRELRKRPGGFKFRRQHPAGTYVLDFYCAAARLAIEVDGSAHDGADAARRDTRRSEFLRSQKVATLRVPASAILRDMEPVIIRIGQVCTDRIQRLSRSGDVPLHHPADGPLPPEGEE